MRSVSVEEAVAMILTLLETAPGVSVAEVIAATTPTLLLWTWSRQQSS
jgi:hypothetical protein